MPPTVSEEIVFLAGPRDVDREIRAAISVVESLNRVLCPRLGMAIRVVRGAADAAAGAGRPQSRINPLVDGCSLFVAVFYRRFGTPTGRSVSGTAEELRRATRRSNRLGSPGILLFFRSISSAYLQDPGPQLRGVMRLRRRIEHQRQLLWVDYRDPNDFTIRFYDQLVLWVLARYDRSVLGRRSPLRRLPGRGTLAGELTVDQARRTPG